MGNITALQQLYITLCKISLFFKSRLVQISLFLKYGQVKISLFLKSGLVQVSLFLKSRLVQIWILDIFKWHCVHFVVFKNHEYIVAKKWGRNAINPHLPTLNNVLYPIFEGKWTQILFQSLSKLNIFDLSLVVVFFWFSYICVTRASSG